MDVEGIRKTIGRNLKSIRDSAGDSREDVAGYLSISASAYAKMERGESPASADRLLLLAQRWNRNVSDFTQGAGPEVESMSSFMERQEVRLDNLKRLEQTDDYSVHLMVRQILDLADAKKRRSR